MALLNVVLLWLAERGKLRYDSDWVFLLERAYRFDTDSAHVWGRAAQHGGRCGRAAFAAL